MADATKTIKPADDAADEAPALAVGPDKPKPTAAEAARDKATAAARQAELDRQAAIVEAIAGAGDELATLGGPNLNPGAG